MDNGLATQISNRTKTTMYNSRASSEARNDVGGHGVDMIAIDDVERSRR